jgi:hypothetical protein
MSLKGSRGLTPLNFLVLSRCKEKTMANNITILTLGGQPKVVSANTVQEAFEKSGLPVGNYTAQINGGTAQMSDSLNDYEHVSFATATKGGRA